MLQTLCPVCSAPLQPDKSVWKCANGHSFDVARQGYVNLLTVDQKRSLHPGDTREMVAARRAFLDRGNYRPIAEKLCSLVETYVPEAKTVLDVGCGEGYYLSQLPRHMERWGVDISKEAVRFAAARDKAANWLTATATRLPFADGVFDCVLSMFALTAAAEFSRVLKEGGVFIQVSAGAEHLLALKRIIYPTLLEKKKHGGQALPDFTLLHSETLRFSFTLTNAEEIQNLFCMTPHFWRISKEGAQALAQTAELTDTAEAVFRVYGRQARKILLK